MRYVVRVRTLQATRYVTPLREGGSLPAIVEGDDLGLYVLKLRGAGQGIRALVAELIAGELARSLGLQIPELVLMNVNPALGRNEPDSEIRELLKRSVGLNLALDYLPRSITFDPVVGPPPSAEVASHIVWFDALVTNVDRTAKNPNLLCWHKNLYVIDHGASLYFHHGDTPAERAAQNVFREVQNHVLLPWANALTKADEDGRRRLSAQVVTEVLNQIPEDWLEDRARYHEFFERRLANTSLFLEEALRARARLL